jgi:hypothetical protein
VPRDRLDLRHVWLEYVERGLRELKPVHTLYTLFRHPGELTVRYLDGKRLQQANPILMMLFLVALQITLQEQSDLSNQVKTAVEQAGVGEGAELAYSAIDLALGPVLRILGYGLPVLSVLGTGVAYRLLFQRNWLTALVFTLHNHMFTYTVGLVVLSPMGLLQSSWVAVVQPIAAIGVTVLGVAYAMVAARRVYDRSLGYTLGGVLAAEVLSYVGVLAVMAVLVVFLLLFAFVGGFVFAILT